MIESRTAFQDRVKAQRFFRPIIDDINRLQTHGLSINGNDVKFSFSTIAADNLAAHFIGGFQCSFSNRFFCRRCYITQAEKALPINSIKPGVRTISDHDYLVDRINVNLSESPLKGVVGLSPMDGLIGFHPITSLPADIMHDFIEGVCPLVLMGILKQASAMRMMTYGEGTWFPAQRSREISLNRSASLSLNMEQNDKISSLLDSYVKPVFRDHRPRFESERWYETIEHGLRKETNRINEVQSDCLVSFSVCVADGYSECI